MINPEITFGYIEWFPNRRLKHPRIKKLRCFEQPVLEYPASWSIDELGSFLDSNRPQIEATARRVAERHRELIQSRPSDDARETLPREIVLPAVGETWRLELNPAPADNPPKGAVVWFDACIERLELQFHGPEWGDSRRFDSLKHWLQHRAKRFLVSQTRVLAQEHGFSPAKIQVRSQRSRWGSCSANGNISLNMTLMLLQPRLVEYVILHELCHLKHHNHSEAFWNLLTERMPDAMARRKELRAAEKALPPWLARLQKASI